MANQYHTTTYQTSAGQHATAVSQLTGGIQGFQGQMVQQMGAHTYLIHSGAAAGGVGGGTLDGEGYPLAHTTRAAPATVYFTFIQS